MDEDRKIPLWLNIILLAIFLSLIIFITIKYVPGIINLIESPRRFRNHILSYGSKSVFVFIFFQIIQVVIAAIPGEFVQVAGGYLYGTFLGTAYSIIGIFIGSAAAFYIARLLGYSLIKSFISKREMSKFNKLVSGDRYEIVMFLLFLIPGIPKDILVYMAGLTPIKSGRFFALFTIARFPALLASSFIGANMQERDYLSAIIVSIIACILFAFGILYRDKIIGKINSVFHR